MIYLEPDLSPLDPAARQIEGQMTYLEPDLSPLDPGARQIEGQMIPDLRTYP